MSSLPKAVRTILGFPRTRTSPPLAGATTFLYGSEALVEHEQLRQCALVCQQP